MDVDEATHGDESLKTPKTVVANQVNRIRDDFQKGKLVGTKTIFVTDVECQITGPVHVVPPNTSLKHINV